MRDAWNVTGVHWSNENIEWELARVEQMGKRLADKFLRDKLILLTGVTLALLFCLFYLDPIMALAVELVILFVVTGYLKKSAAGAMAPVYQMCDPYLEFAYIRAYGERRVPVGRSATVRRVLSLAQCMALAGEPQAAMAIQSNIQDVKTLKVGEKAIYYNTLLLCYGLYGWTDKRQELVQELKRMKEAAGKREAAQLDMILRLEEVKRRQDMGDIPYVEAYFERIPPVHQFQAVGMHFALGMMYMKAGDAERAREHVEYVLDKGNKLYYKKNLEAYLENSLR